MNTNAKIALWTSGALLVVIVAFVAIATGLNRPVDSGSQTPAGQTATNPTAISRDTRMLTDNPDAEVTFVEFLDFECEACGAAYPHIEKLREAYGDRVNFAVRYFPLPGHANGENAALAVESAAQQGAFEPMYKRMFETQAEWGEASESKAEVFRGYANDLGLDLAKFDSAVADPRTLERIRSDFTAGQRLGVQQTPTFFINDEPIDLTSFAQLEQHLVEALEN